MLLIRSIALATAILGTGCCVSPASPPTSGVDVPEAAFYSRSDPTWTWTLANKSSVPLLWFEAPFVGNGMVGAYVVR
jgi:hypothetical protein